MRSSEVSSWSQRVILSIVHRQSEKSMASPHDVSRAEIDFLLFL